MLQLLKNNVVASAAKTQADVSKRELDWYINNYWTLSQQGAVIAGFAFAQVTQQVDEEYSGTAASCYLIFSVLAMGLELCVVFNATLCLLWGPGLVLRGDQGTHSVHEAVNSLKRTQKNVYTFFLVGFISFILSLISYLFIYYHRWLALISTGIIGGAFVMCVVYLLFIRKELRILPGQAVTGEIPSLKHYSYIPDISQTMLASSRSDPSIAKADTSPILPQRSLTQQNVLSQETPDAFFTALQNLGIRF